MMMMIIAFSKYKSFAYGLVFMSAGTEN